MPNSWGMLLYIKRDSNLGGSIWINWSYDMFPSPRRSGFFRLNKYHERRFHVEDPKSPHNKIIMEQPNLCNYVVLSYSTLFMDLKVDEEVNHLKAKVWYINFDGVFSRQGKGDVLALKSPLGHVFKSSYRLGFEASNNVV